MRVIDLLREKLFEIGADGLHHPSGCDCSLVDLLSCNEDFSPTNCLLAKNDKEKADEMDTPYWMEPIVDDKTI